MLQSVNPWQLAMGLELRTLSMPDAGHFPEFTPGANG